MNSISRRIFFLTVLGFVLSAAGLIPVSSTASAQTNVGRISGTVKDTTRAVIPGANVTVTNQATGISRTTTTDEDGFYLVTNLPLGDYSVAVERDGFTKAEKRDYNLVSDGRLSIDFSLEPGGISAAVIVTSALGETVNDTSAEVARVIDGEQVQDLATNGRNYTELLTLIPGAPLLTDDALDLMTSLGVSQPINGNRGNSNNMTIDGGFNLDGGSNGSAINNVGLDFIQEVSIKTSNFSAEYGRNSGASINVSTRSGTNRFRGSVFEYFRNEKLNANSFTNNSQGIFSDDLSKPGAKVLVASSDPRNGKPRAARRPERYNNPGFSVGGPIIKNKLFFFGGIEWKLIRRIESKTATIPTSREWAGDFSFRLRGFDGIVGTGDDGVIRDPNNATSTCVAPAVNSTTGVITRAAVRTGCFGGNNVALRNIIPGNRITVDGAAIAKVYAAMAARAVFTDTPTGNNALFLEANPFGLRSEIIRIDYHANPRNSIFGRFLRDKYDPLIDPYGTLIGSALPTIPTQRDRPGYSAQVGHTWLINPQMVNELKANASWNAQRIQPIGDAWKRETYGFQFPELYPGQGRFPDGIPRVVVQNFAAFDGPARALLAPTTEIQISDNVSMSRGKHSLKTGAIIIRNRKDQNGRTQSLGEVTFNTGSNSRTTSNAFADVLLGNFRTYSEFNNDPLGMFRFTQIEAFVADNWRVRPSLSLELGVRFRHNSPHYTQANNIVNFDPSLYDPARAVTVNSNNTVTIGPNGNRFNGLIRAGNGIPTSELGRVPEGDDPQVLAVPAGAPRGLYPTASILEPRVGFAWSPFKNRKTALRGGFGIFHDRPEGNLIFSQLNVPPYSISAQFENANLSNPSSGIVSALAPFATINAIDPDLKFPYVMSYSLTVQRELPYGFFAEVGYVGNQARHLIRQPDINVPSFAAVLARAQLPSPPNLNTIRPYKGYSQIRMRLSDANSNYNALQVYVTKRKGAITMTASYTWSKVLADADSNTDTLEVGENPFNRAANYGPASFDRRHILATTTSYRIPFFRRSKGFLGAALGGWEISSVLRAQTGAALSITADTLIGNRRADYLGGSLAPTDPEHYFNTAAFKAADDTRVGSSAPGILYGPGRSRFDFALRKRVRLTEWLNSQLRIDMFNALNHSNRTGVNTDFDSGSFGLITGSTSPRSIQVGVRFDF